MLLLVMMPVILMLLMAAIIVLFLMVGTAMVVPLVLLMYVKKNVEMVKISVTSHVTMVILTVMMVAVLHVPLKLDTLVLEVQLLALIPAQKFAEIIMT